MDGASLFRWNGIAQSSNWAWRQVHNSDAGGALVTFPLSAGTHTLVIANREDGVQLDRIYLSAEGDTP